MINVKLTKIESTHSKMRTSEMVGKTGSIPQVGFDIKVFGESLTDSLAFRAIHTTEIKEVTYDTKTKIFIFKTQNSTYQLEVLDKDRTDEDIMSYGRLEQ